MMRFSLSSFVIGVMFGALFPLAWFLSGNPALSPLISSARLDSRTAEEPRQSERISVVDQPAGSEVHVDSVDVSEAVWVAVRELYGGELGNVLGAVRIGGSRLGVVIPLLRATEAERQYAIELYRDDGPGTFDPSAYSVYVDFATGERVISYFNTTP